MFLVFEDLIEVGFKLKQVAMSGSWLSYSDRPRSECDHCDVRLALYGQKLRGAVVVSGKDLELWRAYRSTRHKWHRKRLDGGHGHAAICREDQAFGTLENNR